MKTIYLLKMVSLCVGRVTKLENEWEGFHWCLYFPQNLHSSRSQRDFWQRYSCTTGMIHNWATVQYK